MGIEGANGEPRRRDAPPVAQRALGDPAAAHDTIGGHLRRYVLEGDVRRDEYHAQRAGGQHHRDVHVAGEMGQELGETGIAESGEVQGVLMHRAGDDAVHLARQGESNRLFHRLAGDPARLFGKQRAGSDIFASDQDEIGIQRTEGDGLRHYFRSDPPRIAERHRESRAAARSGRRRTWCDAASRDGA